jgi:transposase
VSLDNVTRSMLSAPASEELMAYRIAGIDVHKKMLAVVVADVEVEGEYEFERRKFGSNPEHLRLLAEWLVEQAVEEVVMESTAQYWQPVWGALERYWRTTCQKREGAGPMSGKLHLAQAQSNRGRRGRKKDFPDAERLVKRLVAQELVLSFVPDPEQRLWRTVTRRKHQLTRLQVRMQNQTDAEPTGGSARRGPYQVVQLGFGSAGGQCAAYAASARRR